MLQIAGGVIVLVKSGVGFTVTVTFCGLEQQLAVMEYAYVTTIGAAVVLVSVSLIPGTIPLEAPCRIPITSARLQANVAPTVALVAVYVKVVPLQMAGGVSVLLSTGTGFTVTTTFCVLLQPAAVVMYTYVTTMGAVVTFVSVSLIPGTRPLDGPSRIPPTAARVQEKDEPPVELVAV